MRKFLGLIALGLVFIPSSVFAQKQSFKLPYPVANQQKSDTEIRVQKSVRTGKKQNPLSGIKILLNPGHGGAETGAAGPNGYLAKDANLAVSLLLRTELLKRGATVVMTRDDDRELSLAERQEMINQEEPTIALTIHYTAVADDDDAEKIKGVRSFWYHPQAKSLTIFLHNYLVKKLGRSSQGVFWNNLALTRPTAAPSVLLELGFMTNPDEFEWITDPQAQKKLAQTLADGIVEWFNSQ